MWQQSGSGTEAQHNNSKKEKLFNALEAHSKETNVTCVFIALFQGEF